MIPPTPTPPKEKKTHPITGKYNKTKKEGKAHKVTPHTNCSTTLIFWLNIIWAFSLKNKQKHTESEYIILTWMQNLKNLIS